MDQLQYYLENNELLFRIFPRQSGLNLNINKKNGVRRIMCSSRSRRTTFIDANGVSRG